MGEGSKNFLPEPDSSKTFWQLGCQVATLFPPLPMSGVIYNYIKVITNDLVHNARSYYPPTDLTPINNVVVTTLVGVGVVSIIHESRYGHSILYTVRCMRETNKTQF